MIEETKARVSVDIDINQILNAIDYLVRNYPDDRLTLDFADRLYNAADIVGHRLLKGKGFNGVCVESGRYSSKKIGNTPKEHIYSLDHLPDGSY